MKFLGPWATALFIAGILAISPCFAQMNSAKKECKCHSKQPAMKHMHETIGFNGCGNCHSKYAAEADVDVCALGVICKQPQMPGLWFSSGGAFCRRDIQIVIRRGFLR
jgi:hypothetical protein